MRESYDKPAGRHFWECQSKILSKIIEGKYYFLPKCRYVLSEFFIKAFYYHSILLFLHVCYFLVLWNQFSIMNSIFRIDRPIFQKILVHLSKYTARKYHIYALVIILWYLCICLFYYKFLSFSCRFIGFIFIESREGSLNWFRKMAILCW